MRRSTLVLSALFVLPVIGYSPFARAQQQNPPAILGFSAADAKTEADLETRFAAIPDPQRMRENIPPERLAIINEELTQAARKLTSPQGLPRRPWMQNLICAPGWYTGYDAKTLLGVREAIEQNRFDEATAQIVLVGHAIDDEAAFVEHVATELDDAATAK